VEVEKDLVEACLVEAEKDLVGVGLAEVGWVAVSLEYHTIPAKDLHPMVEVSYHKMMNQAKENFVQYCFHRI
jgi:hypothetical protein